MFILLPQKRHVKYTGDVLNYISVATVGAHACCMGKGMHFCVREESRTNRRKEDEKLGEYSQMGENYRPMYNPISGIYLSRKM